MGNLVDAFPLTISSWTLVCGDDVSNTKACQVKSGCLLFKGQPVTKAVVKT